MAHNGRVPELLGPSPYDPIAGLYDRWSASVVEDVDFYVEEALAAGGPIVELGVGSGRIAVPIAQAAVDVIGVDNSEGMLAVCRERAEAAGVGHAITLHRGDLRAPGLAGQFELVISPFRALMHLHDDEARLEAFRAVRSLLVPEGRFIFDVFAPSQEDIEATQRRWMEREPGIDERADWNADTRTLTLRVRGPEGETSMDLAWLSAPEWLALLDRAGFELLQLYGWFDRSPHRGGEDMIFIARPR
jgi:SAM-dependent methyltransferase